MQNVLDEKTVNAILIEIKRLENMICDLMNVSSSVASMDLYLDNAAKKFSLSDREFDVLKLIADGRLNNEISEQIQISVSTVKKHIYNILQSRGELTDTASESDLRKKLICPPECEWKTATTKSLMSAIMYYNQCKST